MRREVVRPATSESVILDYEGRAADEGIRREATGHVVVVVISSWNIILLLGTSNLTTYISHCSSPTLHLTRWSLLSISPSYFLLFY